MAHLEQQTKKAAEELSAVRVEAGQLKEQAAKDAEKHQKDLQNAHHELATIREEANLGSMQSSQKFSAEIASLQTQLAHLKENHAAEADAFQKKLAAVTADNAKLQSQHEETAKQKAKLAADLAVAAKALEESQQVLKDTRTELAQAHQSNAQSGKRHS